MRQTKLIYISASLALLLLSAVTALQAAVESKTTEEFVQYGREDAYWVFTASCTNQKQRIIQRKTDGDLWCAKELEGYCDENRDAAAEKACSDEFTQAIESQNQANEEQKKADQERQRAAREAAAAKAREQQLIAARKQAQEKKIADEKAKAAEEAKKAAESKEQINIEEKLLEIEQEKLDLRRQELELQRRAAELETKLGETKE